MRFTRDIHHTVKEDKSKVEYGRQELDVSVCVHDKHILCVCVCVCTYMYVHMYMYVYVYCTYNTYSLYVHAVLLTFEGICRY